MSEQTSNPAPDRCWRCGADEPAAEMVTQVVFEDDQPVPICRSCRESEAVVDAMILGCALLQELADGVIVYYVDGQVLDERQVRLVREMMSIDAIIGRNLRGQEGQ